MQQITEFQHTQNRNQQILKQSKNSQILQKKDNTFLSIIFSTGYKVERKSGRTYKI